MKRFSWIAFITATLVHICITGELISAADRTARLVNPAPWSMWLTIWSWIWQPAIMFLHVFGIRLLHIIYYVWIAIPGVRPRFLCLQPFHPPPTALPVAAAHLGLVRW